MWEYFDFWKFFAGLGIFLFGLSQIEDGLRIIAGRSFRQFLRRNTSNRIRSVFSGTVITALLQSSSIVSLMTLAMVGAGLIKLSSAIGIIIGSNLGTTFTGWIVASLGFKVSIESFALPLLGIGGLIFILLDKYEKPSNVGRMLAGFGLLFLGLEFMKVSIDYLAQNFDLTPYTSYPPIVFLLVGFVFTALIQSSSATMVITLSALNSGIIPFPAATALVIGADLGTTITALLGGMPGAPVKKRVALGHFLFNLVTDIIAFIIMVPLSGFIVNVLNINDQLLALVAFHSSFNLIGILIFVPILPKFAAFLDARFRKVVATSLEYIPNVTAAVPGTAIEALEKDIRLLINELFKFQTMAFEREHTRFWAEGYAFKDQYDKIKKMEGELFEFYNELQQQELVPKESARLNQLILVIRHTLHSAKSLKDIERNLRDIEMDGSTSMMNLYDEFSQLAKNFLNDAGSILDGISCGLEDMTNLGELIEQNYNRILTIASDRKFQKKFPALQLSTILTINREIYSSHKSLILALNNYCLPADIAREFTNLGITVK